MQKKISLKAKSNTTTTNMYTHKVKTNIMCKKNLALKKATESLWFMFGIKNYFYVF